MALITLELSFLLQKAPLLENLIKPDKICVV
jgi:hypothetical protein